MIFQPQDATLVGNVEEMPFAWCVYEHTIHAPGHDKTDVVYVSWCRLAEVYGLLYAKRNSEWASLTATPGTYVYVRIVATGTEADCRNEAMKRATTLRPRPVCNLKGIDTTLVKRRIACSNGQTYASQTEAARILSLPQGMLSRHLSGQLKHVKGLKFWRVE